MNELDRPKSNKLGGVAVFLFGLFGIGFCARFAWLGLTLGQVTGRLGAIHERGSTSYWVSMAACVIGIGLGLVLLRMGLKFMRGTDT